MSKGQYDLSFSEAIEQCLREDCVIQGEHFADGSFLQVEKESKFFVHCQLGDVKDGIQTTSLRGEPVRLSVGLITQRYRSFKVHRQAWREQS